MTKQEIEKKALELTEVEMKELATSGDLVSEDIVAKKEELLQKHIAELTAQETGLNNEEAGNAFFGKDGQPNTPKPTTDNPDSDGGITNPVELAQAKQAIEGEVKWKDVSIDRLLVDRPTAKQRFLDAKILTEGKPLMGKAPVNAVDLAAKFEKHVLNSQELMSLEEGAKKESAIYKQFQEIRAAYESGKPIQVYINESAKPKVVGAKVAHDGQTENLSKLALLSALCVSITEGAIPSVANKIGAKVSKIAERKNLSKKALEKKKNNPLSNLKYTVKFLIPVGLRDAGTYYDTIREALKGDIEQVRVRSEFMVRVPVEEKDGNNNPIPGNYKKTSDGRIVYGTKRLALLVDNVPKLQLKPEYKDFKYNDGTGNDVAMTLEQKAKIINNIPEEFSYIKANFNAKIKHMKEAAKQANDNIAPE